MFRTLCCLGHCPEVLVTYKIQIINLVTKAHSTFFPPFSTQAKLHEELDALFGDSDRPVTMADLREMKYTENCIKEALRLFPSVPFLARELKEEAVIGAYLPFYYLLIYLCLYLHVFNLFKPIAPVGFWPLVVSASLGLSYVEDVAGKPPVRYWAQVMIF